MWVLLRTVRQPSPWLFVVLLSICNYFKSCSSYCTQLCCYKLNRTSLVFHQSYLQKPWRFQVPPISPLTALFFDLLSCHVISGPSTSLVTHSNLSMQGGGLNNSRNISSLKLDSADLSLLLFPYFFPQQWGEYMTTVNPCCSSSQPWCLFHINFLTNWSCG